MSGGLTKALGAAPARCDNGDDKARPAEKRGKIMTTRHNALGVAVITVLAVSAALADTVFVDDDNCPRLRNRHDGTIVRGASDPGALAATLSPDAPILVTPPDGGTAETLDVELTVSVTDPDAETLSVGYFGRSVPADTFVLVALPDTQFYSQSHPSIFQAQTQWIIDNQASMNIPYVAHLGDIVLNGGVTQQWVNADIAMSTLDLLPGLAYGLSVGNHDQDPHGDPDGTSNFNLFFPFTRYEGVASWYGGHYGTDNDNHYVLFSAGGMDFVVVHLEWDTFTDWFVLVWADSVLQAHPARRAIVVSHKIITAGNPGSWGAQGWVIYNALKYNPNLFLMLCGHVEGEGRRMDVFQGNIVHTLVANYQYRPNGGDGWLRILEFVPADNAINVATYSPTLDRFETDADSEFTITYEMSGNAFTEIATVTDVASGAETNVVWPDLERDATYEWYASVSDGHSTTSGPVWSFTVELRTGDVDGDGSVSVADFLVLLAAWGVCDEPCPPSCPADFDGDCAVGVLDLLILLGNWG